MRSTLCKVTANNLPGYPRSTNSRHGSYKNASQQRRRGSLSTGTLTVRGQTGGEQPAKEECIVREKALSVFNKLHKECVFRSVVT